MTKRVNKQNTVDQNSNMFVSTSDRLFKSIWNMRMVQSQIEKKELKTIKKEKWIALNGISIVWVSFYLLCKEAIIWKILNSWEVFQLEVEK